MKYTITIVSLVLAIAVWGCDVTNLPVDGDMTGCAGDADCSAGYVCIDGTCIELQLEHGDGDAGEDGIEDDGEAVAEVEDTDANTENDFIEDVEIADEFDIGEIPDSDTDEEPDREALVIDGDLDLDSPRCDITGNGKVIVVEPAGEAIDFGPVDLYQIKVEYITLCNAGTEALAITNIGLRHGDSTEFQLSHDVTPATLDPGRGMAVAVGYTPRDYIEDHGVVQIISDADRLQVDISLTGRAKTQGQLQVQPRFLQFQNQSGRRIIAMDNVGIAPLTIESMHIDNELHFTVDSVDPGSATGPWTLDPGDFLNAYIAFDGDVTAPDAQFTVRWSTGAASIDTTVVLQAGSQSVCAEPDAGPDQMVAPLATVALDGSRSVDPNDMPESGEPWYQWSFVRKPQGASRAVIVDSTGAFIEGIWSREARPTFYAELAGLYVVQLRINQDDDIGCLVYDTTNVFVAPDETIHIQVRWSASGNDHDLHLVRYNAEGQTDAPGCFTHSDASNINDCHWTNCNTRNATAFPCPARGCPGPDDAPDWGTIGNRTDDPTLDIDDIPATGPEDLNLSLPAIGDYFVAVERYSGSTSAELTVKIWIFGVLQATLSGVSIPVAHNHWNVCWLKVHSATNIEIVPINIIKNSGAGTDRDCAPDVPDELETP